MIIQDFFILIRYQNLFMIIFTQVLVKYLLFRPFHIADSLNNFEFILLVFSMISLAAAGNIINDIFDVETDAINKPEKQLIGRKIAEKTAYNWFFILNIIGVGIGFYLANLVGYPAFSVLFVLPSALLYFYSTTLKRTVLIGNIVISIMVAMIIVMVGIFDLIPAITPQNRVTQKVIFSILIDYAAFAFLVNFIREMVKDQEDIKGDYNAGIKSLPIILGRKRTNNFIFLIALLPLAGVLFYIYTYLIKHEAAVLYAFFLIVAPLLYFLFKIPGAKTKKQYHYLSRLLKCVLAVGLLSIGLYQFILI